MDKRKFMTIFNLESNITIHIIQTVQFILYPKKMEARFNFKIYFFKEKEVHLLTKTYGKMRRSSTIVGVHPKHRKKESTSIFLLIYELQSFSHD